jgi:hypothetical protein
MTSRARFLVAAMAVLFTLVTVGAAFAAEKGVSSPIKGPKVETKSLKGSGEDANVKAPREANKEDQRIEAPADKGGAKTRDVPGWVYVDNRTYWYIDVFRNGCFQGTLCPWGGLHVWCYNGDVLYARADFMDGSYRYWGPDRTFYRQWNWILWP